MMIDAAVGSSVQDCIDRLSRSRFRSVLSTTPEVVRLHERLRLAAAVLADFDADLLQPAPVLDARDSAHDLAEARLMLRAEADSVGGAADRRTLPPGLRRAALRSLAQRATMHLALGWNAPRPDTPLQRAIDRLIDGDPLELEALPRDDVAGLLAAVAWFGGLLPDLPEQATLERTLARQSLWETIERLSGGCDFVGRGAELDMLHALLLSWSRDRRPVLLHGPGGVGKSTLAARAVQPALKRGWPVLWLDFDHRSLDPSEPITVIAEIIRQLAAQMPDRASSLFDLRDTADDWAREWGDTSASFAASRAAAELALLAGRRLWSMLGKQEVVAVVDTFEDVQVLGPEAEAAAIAIFAGLADALPQLSVLLCGRAPSPDSRVQAVPLHDLSISEATSLLRHLVGEARWGAGAADLVNELGGNPLVLRLAARVIQNEGPETLASAEGRASLRAGIRAERLQGVLYGRILSHLQTIIAKKLAFPGLVLRVITAGLIERVLAGPCELDLSAPGAAETVLQALRCEIGLVSVDAATGGVRHRPDVRRIMLETLLSFVDSDTVRAIDDGAVAYWGDQTGPAARAEELYHRLRRGDPREVLAARWDPGAKRSLETALDELPPRGRMWLSERVGATVDEATRREATRDDWRAQARLGAERCLRAGAPEQALQLIHERPGEDADGPLSLLAVEALRSIGRGGEAAALAQERAPALLAAGDVGPAAGLWLEASQVAEAASQLGVALARAERAWGAAGSIADGLLPIRALLACIRLHRKLGREADREVSLTQLHARLWPDYREMLKAQPVLLRELVAELGERDGDMLRLGIERLGLEARSDAERRALRRALAELERAQVRRLAPDNGKALQQAALERLGAAPTTGAFLEAAEVLHSDGPLRSALTKFFQVVVDTNVARSWDDAGRLTLELSNEQRARLIRSLAGAFNSPDKLEAALKAETNIQLGYHLDLRQPLRFVMQQVVELAEDQGWVETLIRATALHSPPKSSLREQADDLGLTVQNELAGIVASVTEADALQHVLWDRYSPVAIPVFRSRQAAVADALCWIGVGKIQYGTGVLIGPDLVLTNWHVVEDIRDGKVPCREVTLGFESTSDQPRASRKLAKDWLLDHAPYSPSDLDRDAGRPLPHELDYALLRLTRSADRAWLSLPDEPAPLLRGDKMIMATVVQQDTSTPPGFLLGSLIDFDRDGSRVRYDIPTVAGSSGSPVFTAALQWAALHNGAAGDVSRGVPLGPIARRLRATLGPGCFPAAP